MSDAGDPQEAALEILERAGMPAWRDGQPAALAAAFERWPGHPDLIEVLLELAQDVALTRRTEGDLLVALLQAQSEHVDAGRAALMLVEAALIAELRHDREVALGLVGQALLRDPESADAREVLRDWMVYPEEAPCVDDLIWRLERAQRAGRFPEEALAELRVLCRAAL